MADIDYPAILPFRPMTQGYGVQPHRPHATTQWEEGKPRSRKRYPKSMVPITMTLKFRPEEKAIWDLFYMSDLDQGTKWFNMQVFIGDSFKTGEVKIVEPPRDSTDINSNWLVSLNLILNTLPLLSNQDFLDIVNTYSLSFFPDVADKVHMGLNDNLYRALG